MKYMLSDKVFYPAAAVLALLLIAVSIVWPQGLGLPSPAPFGHAVVQPDYFRMIHDQKARHRRQEEEKIARLRAQHLVERQAAAAAASASASSASLGR